MRRRCTLVVFLVALAVVAVLAGTVAGEIEEAYLEETAADPGEQISVVGYYSGTEGTELEVRLDGDVAATAWVEGADDDPTAFDIPVSAAETGVYEVTVAHQAREPVDAGTVAVGSVTPESLFVAQYDPSVAVDEPLVYAVLARYEDSSRFVSEGHEVTIDGRSVEAESAIAPADDWHPLQTVPTWRVERDELPNEAGEVEVAVTLEGVSATTTVPVRENHTLDISATVDQAVVEEGDAVTVSGTATNPTPTTTTQELHLRPFTRYPSVMSSTVLATTSLTVEPGATESFAFTVALEPGAHRLGLRLSEASDRFDVGTVVVGEDTRALGIGRVPDAFDHDRGYVVFLRYDGAPNENVLKDHDLLIDGEPVTPVATEDAFWAVPADAVPERPGRAEVEVRYDGMVATELWGFPMPLVNLTLELPGGPYYTGETYEIEAIGITEAGDEITVTEYSLGDATISFDEPGTTTIRAWHGAESVRKEIDVEPRVQALEVDLEESLVVGETIAISVTATDFDGTERPVTADAHVVSENESVLSFDTRTGTAVAPGEATIVVEYGWQHTTASVTVSEADDLGLGVGPWLVLVAGAFLLAIRRV